MPSTRRRIFCRWARYEIWYPEAMAEQDRTWPVVMMCNGTGVAASRYTPHL